MKKEFVIMYCNECERHYRLDDEVVLDSMNTILHKSCYQKMSNLPIKDTGLFKEIIYKYDFFKQLR